jgi:hypothetical protein
MQLVTHVTELDTGFSGLALSTLPSHAARADKDLGCWAQQLVDTQEVDGCLRQPASQPAGLPPQLRGSLYNRRSYRRMFDLLWASRSNEGQQPGFVVTGTPGTGKSAFALYLIQQLGIEQQTVFYEYEEERRWCRIKFDFSGPQAVAKSVMASVHDGEHSQLHIGESSCCGEGAQA